MILRNISLSTCRNTRLSPFLSDTPVWPRTHMIALLRFGLIHKEPPLIPSVLLVHLDLRSISKCSS